MSQINRRDILFRALALGAVSSLPACNYEDPNNPDLADKFLHAMSAWNDRIQQALFNPRTLAPSFTADEITRPPRFNAYYDISQVTVVDPATYRLQLGGQIQDKTPWTLAGLNALPQEQQITRLICVEGWRVIGQWGGVPLGSFLRRVGSGVDDLLSVSLRVCGRLSMIGHRTRYVRNHTDGPVQRGSLRALRLRKIRVAARECTCNGSNDLGRLHGRI